MEMSGQPLGSTNKAEVSRSHGFLQGCFGVQTGRRGGMFSLLLFSRERDDDTDLLSSSGSRKCSTWSDQKTIALHPKMAKNSRAFDRDYQNVTGVCTSIQFPTWSLKNRSLGSRKP